MKIKNTASTIMQMEYAKKRIFTKGKNKAEIAQEVGFSPAVCESPKSKIEDHQGYKNAVSVLAIKTNTMALDIMEEFERRGLSEFSDKNLIGALSAITAAWTRFNAPQNHHKDFGLDYDNGKNPLRTVILQTVNNQTIASPADIREAEVREEVIKEEIIKEDEF